MLSARRRFNGLVKAVSDGSKSTESCERVDLSRLVYTFSVSLEFNGVAVEESKDVGVWACMEFKQFQTCCHRTPWPRNIFSRAALKLVSGNISSIADNE